MTPIEIATQLEKFETVACRLGHERVRLDPESKRPISRSSSLEAADDRQYARVGLCAREVRSKRIGCAHTMANSQFNRILDALNPPDGPLNELREKFNALIQSIYEADHRKGDLEKKFAIFLELSIAGEDRKTALRADIAELEAYHSDCMEELERTRTAMVARLHALATIRV